MRKIDTTAYNKRLHSEILELDKMLKQIKPEHINLFDADLIKSAQSYVQVISDANWADNSNFNGIEMHKIKDIINNLRLNGNQKYRAKRDIWYCKSTGRSADNRIFAVSLNVPDGFDGRNSYVSTSVFLYNQGTNSWSQIKLDKRGRRMIEEGGHYTVYKKASKIDVNVNIYVGAGYDMWLDTFVFYWK
jgi:hypothetical protein